MKRISALLILLALVSSARAANVPPTGNTGDIQMNGGSGRYAPLTPRNGLMETTSGSSTFLDVTISGGGGSPAFPNGSLQYNNNGIFGPLSPDTLASYAAHNTIANGVSYDPRDATLGSNPALCSGYNIFTSDGHTLTYNYSIPFVGSSSTDNTNFMVFTEPGDGSGSATILNTSQFSVTGVNSGSGGTITLGSSVPNGQLIIVVHDDANGFINASTASVANGGYVMVPNTNGASCTIYGSQTNGTVLADGAQVIGQNFTPNYGFQGQGQLPTIRVIAPTGAAPNFGFNISGKNQQFYEGFEITTNVPGHNQLGFLNVPVLIGANGSSGAGGGQSPGIVAQYVTFNSGGVGFGAPIGGNSAYIFSVLRFNNFTANNAGVYGPLSDLVAVGNNFSSNGAFGSLGSAGGMIIGPQEGAVGVAGAARLESNRFEFNREGIVVQAGSLISFEGNQFDGNSECGFDLRGSWSFLNITGGWFRGNANGGAGGSGVTAAGQDAHICINGAGNSLHLTNVNFLDGYARGFQAPLGSPNANTPPYVLDVNTAGSGVDDIDMEGATAQFAAGNNGASVTDFAIYRNGRPTNLKIDLNGQAVQGKIANGSFSAQARGLPSNQWSAYDAFGDQQATSTAYVSPIYSTIIGNGMGVGSSTFTTGNFSTFDCDLVDQQIFANYSPSLTGNPLVTWLPGVADPTFGNSFYQAHLADTNACRLAGLTWMAIPPQYKTYAQATSVTTTGSWGNFASYGGALGLTSTTQNSALSFTVTTQGPIYVGYELQATSTSTASGGVFTVSVDGSLAATVSSGGNGAWTAVSYCGSYNLCPTSQAPAAIRVPIPATASGSHTITTNVLSATSTANPVTILGVWEPPGKPYAGGNPTVFLGGQLYEYNDAESAATANFNADELIQANQLFADGLSVNFVDVRNYINSTSDMIATPASGSPLAPNENGQQHIADAFGGVIQYISKPSGGNQIDPRDYGAACNATRINNITITSGSADITSSSYAFSNNDIGKAISMWAGTDPGPLASIISVNTGTNTATLSATRPSNGSTVTAIMEGVNGNDDTTAFSNAAIAGAAIGYDVLVPDGCMVHNLTLPNAVTLRGAQLATGYGYAQSVKPTLWIGSSGFNTDTTYGININGAGSIALKGFQVSEPTTLPYFGFANYGGSACVGLDGGTQGTGPAIILENMTFQFCPVGFGLGYGRGYPVSFTASIAGNQMNVASMTTTALTPEGFNSGYLSLGRTVTGAGVPSNTTITNVPFTTDGTGIYTLSTTSTVGSEAMTSPALGGKVFGQSHFSNYQSNGVGFSASITDWASIGDVIGNNFSINVDLEQFGGAYGPVSSRFIGDRIEEGGYGVYCSGCLGVHFEGNEFQFMGGPALALVNGWRDINVTGGFIQNNDQNDQCSSFTGTISSTILTVTSPSCGTNASGVQVNQVVTGSGVTANTYITANGTGVGGAGTYTVNNSQSVGPVAMSSRRYADIVFQGTGGTNLTLGNVDFFVTGGTQVAQYTFQNTATTAVNNVEINGGILVAPVSGNQNGSYQTALFNWLSSTPVNFKVNAVGYPQLITGVTDLSINSLHALGLQTSSAASGTIFDAHLANTTTSSSIWLPSASSANRPAAPQSGMIRYNTDLGQFEGYNGAWGSLGGSGPVVVKTANYNVTALDSGTTFTNSGAGGSVTFTLPTAAAALNYCFFVDSAQNEIIAADTGHTICNGLSLTSTGGNLTSNGVGNQLCVRALNTTEWYVYSGPTGSWTVN